MTKELPCETRDELETVKQTLDTLGIGYDVEFVVRAQVPEDSNVMAINNDTATESEAVSDGGTVAKPNTADSAGSELSVPTKGTKSHAVLLAIAKHDKEWVTVDDIAGHLSLAQRKRVAGHVSNLKKDGVLKQQESDQKGGHGRFLKAYKPREIIRRELAAYDSLNEVPLDE